MSTYACPMPAVLPEAMTGAISEPPSPKRILVPIDFSRPSIDALRHARVLADGHAQLILLNIVEDPGSFRTLDAVGQRRARHKLRACQLQELADRELGSQIPASIEIREGNPSVEIAKCASERHVDLIVVGRHPSHAFWRGGQGRTARKLSRKAPCPVLLLNRGQLNRNQSL